MPMGQRTFISHINNLALNYKFNSKKANKNKLEQLYLKKKKDKLIG